MQETVTYSQNFKNWAHSIFPENKKLHDAINAGEKFTVGDIITAELKKFEIIDLRKILAEVGKNGLNQKILEIAERYEKLSYLQGEWAYFVNRD